MLQSFHVVCTRPLKERRAILEQNIRPIRHHVQLSEYHLITKSPELSAMIAKVSRNIRFLFVVRFLLLDLRDWISRYIISRFIYFPDVSGMEGRRRGYGGRCLRVGLFCLNVAPEICLLAFRYTSWASMANQLKAFGFREKRVREGEGDRKKTSREYTTHYCKRLALLLAFE